MDVFLTDKAPNIIPKGVSISDMTSVLDAGQGESSPEMRWRWAVLEIVKDTLQVINEDCKKPRNPIWEDEARHRATAFLQLAFVNSIRKSPSQQPIPDYKQDLRPISRLARCYRSLYECTIRGPLECQNVLCDVFFGLASTYQPVVRNVDFRISSRPVSIDSHRRRALALFTSWAAQRTLERAFQLGSAGKMFLTLQPNCRSMVKLLLETNDPAGTFLARTDHELASRLAAKLQAEFVCHHEGVENSTLELRFPSGNARVW
jgi:hypothetical protein